MARRMCVLVSMLALMVTAARAQDARTVLQAASTAMGAGSLKTLQYSGSGWNAGVGQSYSPDEDWPRFEVTRYTRMIDYEARSSREDFTRRQGNYPPRGGGGTPIRGEQEQTFIVSGEYAWNLQANNANPQPAAAELRQLDIWLSPYGFLKAALAADDASAFSMMLDGRKVTMVSFTFLGKYRVNGTINDQNLVERVQTWVPNPVFGDMVYEHRYTEYKDFNGIRFPALLHSHQGDPRLNPGHNWMEIRVTDVRPNVVVSSLTVPDAVRQAAIRPVRVESTHLGNHVWLLGGSSHNSVAVEFRDFVAVVEAPENEDRSLAVIAQVQKLCPDKPIRYVVNTHHHFDHSGGLRTYVAHGAIVVTHEINRDFYENVFFYPGRRTMRPDLLSTRYPWFSQNRIPAIETVTRKYVISDGVRTMEIHPVRGLAHNSNMLMVYLPSEKILINADMYSPPAAGAPAPALTPGMRTLWENIQRLKLDVVWHVPIHGKAGPMDDFMKIVGD